MAFKVGGGRGSAGKGGGKTGGKSQGSRQPSSRREGTAGAGRTSSGPGFKTSGSRKPAGPKTGGSKSYGPPRSGQGTGQGTGGGQNEARPQWRDIPEFKGTRGGHVDKSPAKVPGKSYSSEYADLRETPKGRTGGGEAGRSYDKAPGSGTGRSYADRGQGSGAGKGFSRDRSDDRREAPKGRTGGEAGRSYAKPAGKGPGNSPGYSPGNSSGRPSGTRSSSGGRVTGRDAGREYDTRQGEGVARGKEPYRRPATPTRPPRQAEPETDAYAMPEGPDDKVMGVNPVLEMLRSGGRAVDAVYIDKDKGGPHFAQMISLARASGITVKIVPREALDKMSLGLRHQGAIASVAPKEYADAGQMVDKALAKGGLPLIVVLDGIEDPQNLGSIIRTAETAGADGVIIPEHRAAHLTASVARASAGALEHMPVAKVTSLTGFLGTLKEKGFWVVGLEAGTGTDYTTFGMDVPLAIVLGSEGGGVRPGVKKVCDALVSLPVLGKISSLNVSVTAGIVLFEALRQRSAKK